MRTGRGGDLDWQDAAAYAPLLGADRSLFAWEWLRRDPRYRAAVERAFLGPITAGRPLPEEFGLVAFEDPQLAVPRARPLWTAAAHPYVLPVAHAGPQVGFEDLFDLGLLAAFVTIVSSDHADHLLLCNGFHGIRLDGPPGIFGNARVALSYRLEGVEGARRPMLTLRRFLALCQGGNFPRSLYPREPRARRWILMLRAYDALGAGVSQREIAAALLSRTVEEPRWRSRESSVRSQVQRLAVSARRFVDGGYRELLG